MKIVGEIHCCSWKRPYSSLRQIRARHKRVHPQSRIFAERKQKYHHEKYNFEGKYFIQQKLEW